jgi:hypothetical protein
MTRGCVLAAQPINLGTTADDILSLYLLYLYASVVLKGFTREG